MKRIPISIIHTVGFLLTILLSTLIFTKTAVIGVDGISAKLISMFRFQHTGNLECMKDGVVGQNQLNGDKEADYTCDRSSCQINIYSIPNHQLIKSFPAVDNAGIIIIDIDNFFFDAVREIISFTTSSQDLSARIVMNFEGDLLHSIDETPGKNRTLSYLGYQPDSGMLVYRDNNSPYQYFYSVDTIYFARRHCP